MNLRGRNKVDPTFNMSSMTDIVFFIVDIFYAYFDAGHDQRN